MKPILIVFAMCLVLAVVFSLAAWQVKPTDSNRFIPYPSGYLLVASFAHEDHTDQDCVDCHHNFIDDTGGGLCFDCHKTDPEISPLIEEQFHDLCRNCHLSEQALGHDHGPTRECITCHIKEDRP